MIICNCIYLRVKQMVIIFVGNSKSLKNIISEIYNLGLAEILKILKNF